MGTPHTKPDKEDTTPPTVIHGDARALPLADNTIAAIITDPPYELGFMGKAWDATGVAFDPATWREAWRVLRPGGHLVAFGGTRTYHRLAVAIEDAGLEIRDCLTWLYGSGFPKSLDVAKAIDKAAGAEREVVGTKAGQPGYSLAPSNGNAEVYGAGRIGNTGDPVAECNITAPATDDAAKWQGWGTALKPGHEPIVLARKPFPGNVAANVLTHSTGALNIDASRIPAGQDYADACASAAGRSSGRGYGRTPVVRTDSTHDNGRWPPNVLLSHCAQVAAGQPVGDACADGCAPGCPVAEIDSQSGVITTRRSFNKAGQPLGNGETLGGNTWSKHDSIRGHDDTGGASRFYPTFRYQAKAPTAERPRVSGVAHPTVKPVALMEWLVRLITPPGGIILDPFTGSGTTLEAAYRLNYPCIGIELERVYVTLARRRLRNTKLPEPTLPF